MAMTMNSAVIRTNVPNSGRIGEPFQNASSAATSTARTETKVLTSFGMPVA